MLRIEITRRALSAQAITRWRLRAFSATPKPGPSWDHGAHHVPTSAAQKAFLAGGSAAVGLLNTFRGDMIAVLGETTGSLALRKMHQQMLSTAEGREVLALKPLVTADTLAQAREQPAGTFGHAYAHFMQSQEYSPEERTRVRFVDDAELAYVMQRYREVHDFWHVLTGLPTTVLGELAQKALEMLQTGLPMAAVGVAFGPLRLNWPERRLLLTRYLPWAAQCHRQCAPLLPVFWERYFSHDLGELRRQLRILPPPQSHAHP